jgi:DNA polymerase sigma
VVDDNLILSSIKKQVHQIVPNAQVFLFGSRANDSATEESDWDILIITQQAVDRALKRKIQDQIFPLSVQLASFINLLIVQEQDWLNNPSYYSLHQSIAAGKVLS